MISQAESFQHLALAAGVSTALFAFGLRGGRFRHSKRRVRRWPSLLGGVLGFFMTVGVAIAGNIGPAGSDILGPIAFGILAAVAVAGAALIRFGLRGKLVGDHPHCRRCGFDLFGRTANSTVCTECGASLTEAPADAIVIGQRQRRMVPLTLGLFVTILSLALCVPIASSALGWAARYNWTEMKPTSWLVADLAKNPIAIEVLWQRARTGQMNEADFESTIDALLDTPFPSTRGLIGSQTAASYIGECGWLQGKLSEATMRRILSASLTLELHVAPKTARGHAIRYWVGSPDYALARSGISTPPLLGYQRHFALNERHALVNGWPMPDSAIDDVIPRFSVQWMSLPQAGYRVTTDSLPAPLALGTAMLELRLSGTISLNIEGRPPITESRDLVLTGTAEVVDPAELYCPPLVVPLVNAATSHAATTRLADDANVMLATPATLPVIDVVPQPDGQLCLTFQTKIYGTICGDVFVLTADGPEKKIGPVIFESYGSLSIQEPPPVGSTILLRPTPERGVEMFEPIGTFQMPIRIPVTRQFAP